MSLSARVFSAVFLMLVASLLIAAMLFHRSFKAEGISRSDEALQVGERVLRDMINRKWRDLQRSSGQLASTEVLQQALIAGEPSQLSATLQTLLEQHSESHYSRFVWLLNAEANIVARAGVDSRDARFPHPAMLQVAANQNWAHAGLAVVDDALYQLSLVAIFVPEKASQPKFWLVTGVEFDWVSVSSLAELTGLELIITDAENRPWSQFLQLGTPPASTLPETSEFSGRENFHFKLATREFRAKRIAINRGAALEIDAILLKSNTDIDFQLVKLDMQLVLGGILVLVVAMMVTGYLSRSITRPLLQLVDAAQAIGRGEYQCVMLKHHSPEIVSLARAFDVMQNNIAERESEVEYIAYHDHLTKLPNRNAFIEAIKGHIDESQASAFAVCVMDFDRFREINDALGHHNGDLILAEFAQRLMLIENEVVQVARLGGDEFAVLVKHLQQLDSILQALQALSKETIEVEQIALEINTSIGVAKFPEHGDNPNALLQTAEISMYFAKQEHKSYAIYDKNRDHHSVQRLTLIAELKWAIERGQMQLHYQPKLHLKSQQFRSVECLIRWVHPQYGFVNPEEFIGYAEQTGEIKAITRWVIATAFSQIKTWRGMGHQLNAAINISALDLGDTQFAIYVADQLEFFQLPAAAITLEITESAVMRDLDQAMQVLTTLQQLGVRLSIDDYGTGYSSMAQLKRMPVTELKIDKSFIFNLTESHQDLAIVKSTVELAHNLGLEVVAEGVENQESLTILNDLGCEYAQGFYLSRPLDINKLNLWIANNKKRIAAVA